MPSPRGGLFLIWEEQSSARGGPFLIPPEGPIFRQGRTSSCISLPAPSNNLPMLISEPAVSHSHLYGSCCLSGKASLQNLPTKGQFTLHYLITSFLSGDDLLGFSLSDSLCPPLLWRNPTHPFRDLIRATCTAVAFPVGTVIASHPISSPGPRTAPAQQVTRQHSLSIEHTRSIWPLPNLYLLDISQFTEDRVGKNFVWQFPVS